MAGATDSQTRPKTIIALRPLWPEETNINKDMFCTFFLSNLLLKLSPL